MSVGITRRSMEAIVHYIPILFLMYNSRLTSCAFQFMFGKMYTVFSIKAVFMTALFIFELGSLLSAVAPTSTALVVGRAVSGIGSAGVVAGVFT